ncbi:hypothetical protein HON22_01105 [Candidatus Peregrinibacteria bacterium]|jgi:hypothetical protein|nr:hypothetical protein [Candidatus Peregrinibacteria bacterium]
MKRIYHTFGILVLTLASQLMLVFSPTYVYAESKSFDTPNIQKIIPQHSREEVKNLPRGDISTHFLPRFIDILMKLSYTIAVAIIIYSGIIYIISGDDDGEITKAKDIFIYGVAGFLIITVSYAIVQGVIRFQFFQ